VIDFTRAALGPVCTKYLADFGAEVIKIESTDAPDVARGMLPYRDGTSGINRSCSYAWFHTSKRSITLNLKTPQGKEIAKRLVSVADIVIENFTPGTMERLGLTYEEFKQVNPKIIMVSLSALGQSGPYRSMPALGNFIQAWSGMNSLIGMSGREHPIECGVPTPDYIGAHLGVMAVIGSLLYRQRTGKGQYIDISMLEVSVPFIGHAVLDYAVNGREATLMGNRSSYAAPHGVYRCKGDDRWCAISVFNDEEWAGFIKATGNPDWASDNRFATMLGRKENEDELDRNIEAWTINHTAEEAMTLLQARGVAAAVVQNGKDLVEDPQLGYRHHFRIAEEHQELGTHYSQAPSFILSKTTPQVGPTPCLGQDNEYVFTQILGMSDTQFVDLYTSGVI
jgi:benzylsuccinate CoA-transferase BbsF subunit